MPRPEIFNPTWQEISDAGDCWSYLTALDHLLGTEWQWPVSAFLADFTQPFLLREWIQTATASLGEVPRKSGEAADSHLCKRKRIRVRYQCSYDCLSASAAREESCCSSCLLPS